MTNAESNYALMSFWQPEPGDPRNSGPFGYKYISKEEYDFWNRYVLPSGVTITKLTGENHD